MLICVAITLRQDAVRGLGENVNSRAVNAE